MIIYLYKAGDTMSTVQQILTQVQTQYPNVLTNTELLTFGNEILRKTWKWMNEDDIYTFNLIADQATYGLPTDGLALDKISVIEIAQDSTLEDWTSHSFRGLLHEFDSGAYFYDAFNGIFGLYPVPATSITDGGKIYYGAKFTLMSISDLTVTPRVNEDYHSLIVNYICMKAALCGDNPDTARHNDFATAFNDDWNRLMFEFVRTKAKTPKKRRSNNWWGRNTSNESNSSIIP